MDNLTLHRPVSYTQGMASSSQRGYGNKWQKARLQFLKDNPLCKFCLESTPSRITLATVVDHIKAHKGNSKLFWSHSNWQPLCKPHHDSTKQRMEKNGINKIGLDGWPID